MGKPRPAARDSARSAADAPAVGVVQSSADDGDLEASGGSSTVYLLLPVSASCSGLTTPRRTHRGFAYNAHSLP